MPLEQSKRILYSNRQSGAALLIFMLAIVMGVVMFYLTTRNADRLRVKQQQKTIQAMATAKDALIAYVISHYERKKNSKTSHEFVRLPCPDSSAGGLIPEGGADGNCGSSNSNNRLGRFPWRTLELDVLKDGNNECLWYAVSGNYKNSIKKVMINEDTKGRIQLYKKDGASILQGQTPETRVVAAVISAGAVLNGQKRTAENSGVNLCGGNYRAIHYLENVGTIDNAKFQGVQASLGGLVSFGLSADDGNDMVLPITRSDIWDAVLKRSDFIGDYDDLMNETTTAKIPVLLRQVTDCIAEYGKNNDDEDDRRLPYAAPLMLVNYSDAALYKDKGGQFNGRIPFDVSTSKSSTNNKGNGRLFADCSNSLNMADSEASRVLQHWQDHFYYAVAKERSPAADAEDSEESCDEKTCLTNGGEEYAAMVFYSGSALEKLSQTRNPELLGDSDTKKNIQNYLEGKNAKRFLKNGNEDPEDRKYEKNKESDNEFNDIAYCIKSDLKVVICPD